MGLFGGISPLGLSFKIVGLSTILNSFTSLMVFTSRKSRLALHERMGLRVVEEIQKNFAKEANEGSPWPRLSPITLERRAQLGFSGQGILVNTGRLNQSFLPDGTETRWKVTPDYVRIGSDVPYAASHEFGIKLPLRKILPTQKRAEELALKEMNKFIREAIVGSGLA